MSFIAIQTVPTKKEHVRKIMNTLEEFFRKACHLMDIDRIKYGK